MFSVVVIRTGLASVTTQPATFKPCMQTQKRLLDLATSHPVAEEPELTSETDAVEEKDPVPHETV